MTDYICGMSKSVVCRWLLCLLFVAAIHGAAARGDEITIVAFGDSTTATRSTVNQVYAARLPTLLRARGIEAKVVNAGVGGSHTGRLTDNARHRRQHALDRFDKAVRNHNPDVVVVQFGWNDSWIDSDKLDGPSRIPVKDYAGNLKHITETLRQDGSKVILMTPNRPNSSVEEWRVARTQQYVDAVRNLAATGSLPLVDVWAEYERFNSAHGLNSDGLLLDSVHPNDQGHELVARLLADSIGDLKAVKNTAASGPPEPGIQTGFESFAAGPFTTLSDESGTWEAKAGHAIIHTDHSRSGIQSLRLPGGMDRQVVWTPAESETKPDRLRFWFERWTSRNPWDFRVEALIGDQWQTLHHDTNRALTRSFRNRLSLKLGDRTPTKFRFTCTAPEKSGVMIDDLWLGRGEYREPVPTETPTREVDGRVETDLFYNRMNGAANYRIPSLNVTNKGTLLAVCDCRRDRGGDAPNNIDQVLRRSTDNGKTWSDVSTIVDFPGKRAAGDPSLTVDRTNGTIWLCYVYADEGIGLAGGRNEPGYGNDTFHIHLRRSDDDGLTWSDPIGISKQIKPPEWFAIWTAPGVGIQTRDGRLMICFSGRKRLSNDKWTATSNIAYSDDHGKTWSSFKELGLGTNESQVVELDDGSYMINMRQNGGRARWVSISRDRGKTWSKQEQHPALIEPGGCQASLLRLTSESNGDDRNRLLFCNPASTQGRRNMTVRLSYDEGKTWPVEKVIYAGSSAYSSMAVLPDGSIGLLYERDGRRVTFTKFTLGWLTDGEEQLGRTDNE